MIRPLPLSTLALVLALAPVAAAQDYEVVATQSDLADGGTLSSPEPRCIAWRPTQEDFVFFDETSDLLATYDPGAASGSRTDVLRAAAALDADAGLDVNRCRDLDVDAGGNVFAAVAGDDNADVLLRAEADGSAGTRLTSPTDGDGITGLAADDQTVFLARGQFFGAPEDGLYRVDASDADQTPIVVVTNADLDLNGIDVASTGDVYMTSSEFAAGAFVNVIVRVEDPLGAATLSTVASPCTGGSPVFENCGDGGLEDLKTGRRNGAERLFVFNNSFGAPEGEEIAQFNLDGSNPVTVFTQSDFLADPDISAPGYTPGGGGNGYMDYDEGSGTLYLAGDDAFDGEIGLYAVVLGGGVANAPEAPGVGFDLAVWPNPTAGSGAVRLTADEGQAVEVAVHDGLGRRVALLFRGDVAPGAALAVPLDLSALPAGVYAVRASGASGVVVRRLVVVR